MSESIQDRADFDFVRYGSVWEDADVLCEALGPVARGGKLLSIASAGDNVLALLTLDPESVTAVDLSPAQLACLDLRRAAFRELAYEDLLRLLGVTESESRTELYRSLRQRLTAEARSFWDRHPHAVARGVLHAGKFERYFSLFRRFVLPLIHGRKEVDELCRLEDPAAQREFYRRRWDSARWRLVFRLFFSRAVMGRLGRDPAFFAQVDGPVGERILERTRWALTEIPAATNPYLQYILTGGFPVRALPRYLRPESFAVIRDRLDRVRPVRGSVEAAPGRPFAGFNLSDVFEYMPPDEYARSYGSLLDLAAPGARLVYWNMLVPRAGSSLFPARARALRDAAERLHREDRAWFYSGFQIDEVIG